MTDDDTLGQQDPDPIRPQLPPLDPALLGESKTNDAAYIAAGALLVFLSCFIVVIGAAFVLRIVVESWPC